MAWLRWCRVVRVIEGVCLVLSRLCCSPDSCLPISATMIFNRGPRRVDVITPAIDQLCPTTVYCVHMLEIEDWWLRTQTVNKGLPSYVWTWYGQPHITVLYNEAFYEHELVEQFKEEWRSIIAKEFVL